jgi:tetratricopeptide (TPR) repeat protein
MNKTNDKTKEISFVLFLTSHRVIHLLVVFLFALIHVEGRSQAKRPVRSAIQFEKLAREAEAARAADRAEDATPLYVQALKLNPKWSEGWWRLGSIFYERDRYKEASEAFRNLTVVDPKMFAAWSMLGLCEFQLTEFKSALEHLRKGNSAGFGDNRELARVAAFHEAMLLNRFENYELALDVLRKILNPQQESPEVLMTLGISMLRLPLLPQDLPVDQREVVAKTGRASYLLMINRGVEAKGEFKELIEAFPETPGVHYAYGISLLRDLPDEAVQEFKREIRLSPGHVPARLQIAFEYIKRREYATGLPYAEEAVRLAPALFATHNALGRILLETAETGRAVSELETALKLAPKSPEMYFTLARAYAKAGRSQDAAKARAEFTRLDKLRRSQ